MTSNPHSLPTFNSPDGRMLLKEDGTGDYVRRTDYEAVVAELIADRMAALRTIMANPPGGANLTANVVNPPEATD